MEKDVKTNKPAVTKDATPLWKKIVLIVSLSIIAMFIVLIIVFACVPVNLKPNLSFNAPHGVTVAQVHGTSGNFTKDNEEFLTIVEKINKGFKTNFLNSFTNGLNSTNKYDVTRGASANKSELISASDTLYTIEFKFGESQPIYTADGKPFKYGSSEQTFNSFMVVLNKSGFGSVNIWFFNEGQSTSYINLSGFGNFKDLIKYLDQLKKEA